jgi:hypothetical protein
MMKKNVIIVLLVAVILVVVGVVAVFTLNNNDSKTVNVYGIERYNCEYFSFDIDGKSLDMGSLVSSGSVITVSDGSGWALDSETKTFTCAINGLYYSVVIVISGTNDPIYAISDDTPTITLGTVNGDISVNITCSMV